MNWFNDLNTAFAVLIANTQFGAVVAGVLCAIGLTQLVKMVVIHSDLPNGPWRLWYLTTAATGTFSTYVLWPGRQGAVWGIIAGTLLAPMAYLIGTRTLYKFMPALEGKISATPRTPQP